jgi:hypothetical protein
LWYTAAVHAQHDILQTEECPVSHRPPARRYRSLAPGLGQRLEAALNNSAQWRRPVTFLQPPSKHQRIRAFIQAHPQRSYNVLTFYRWTNRTREVHPQWPRLRMLATDLGIPVCWLGFGMTALHEIDALIRLRDQLPPSPS